ncbi:hypothetical protein BCR36DRAFT_282318 [Piromyces finnis]|uniref:Peroxisomal membrane protein PEX14 n=1 Tax=Piromyces finnis TaxID=1754191 RepID=A0A1Y1VFM1_9FUNG|nr:hypothetical protein BCR36DRAFT_282318 [Piromyces finnis]|eukprot:ORX54904.1 hypothetical protein BCR36DRAFT_282318 [Piromyces finnis]
MDQTNSTIDNDAAASSSTKINLPQLTDERKQEIRKKLLERQRQARLKNSSINAGSTNSTSASSSSSNITSNSINSNTTNISSNNNNVINDSNEKEKEKENEKPPNQEMIKKAIAFLSSPKVQGSPTSRKHSFLLSKGCTKKEIELAEKEIEEKSLYSSAQSLTSPPASSTSSTNVSQGQAPPPLPPRNYQQQNIQVIYRNPPLTRIQKVRRGLLIILFSASILKGISIIVKKEIMKPLRELYLQYSKYLKTRNNILNTYMLQIVEYCKLFINDKTKDKVKQVKTIEEINKEKETEKTEKESEENEVEEESSVEKEKKSGQRKAIKLKIHRKKEVDNEIVDEETQLVKKDSSEVRTLSAAVQDYIDCTNSFETNCKDAVDTYTYDIERNSDLFSGSLGQTMKLSSEVYQMVSREVYYNSANSSFYMDSYQASNEDEGPVSLYSRVNNIKSEIRRLKGMLLNHRNFPKYKQRALVNVTSNTAASSSS